MGTVRVLLIEDDTQLSELLERVFREEGHMPTVCATAADADAALEQGTYDLAVLDWMLPDGDGLGVCARMREYRPMMPVLMLTARGELEDRLAGLNTGADDYVTKPFEIEELLARMRVLERRVARAWVFKAGSLEIDRRNRVVKNAGNRLDLTSREYDLLARLADSPNECVSRQALLLDVWKMDFDPDSGIIDVHVSRLRDKLGDLAWMVETVRGQGLRLQLLR
jgi:DNA-binding response OmpR family regulator